MALTREQAIAWTARWRALGAAAAAAADRSPEERLRTLGRLRSFALAAGRMREAATSRSSASASRRCARGSVVADAAPDDSISTV
jgi:hypothetical protein